jgi:type III pantothenate kinase
MLLTLKVGNTTIAVGAFALDQDLKSAPKVHWHLATRHDYTPDELGLSLVQFLRAAGLEPSNIKGVVISSVVPPLNWTLTEALQRYFEQEALFLDHRWGMLELDVREPERVGTDRIADCLAGYALYGGDQALLIIDFGTATTFNLVSRDGRFLGGAIAPTMELAAETLVRRTAQLFKVELIPPPSVVGKDTQEHLQAGIVLGFLELVEGLIERFQRTHKGALRVVATGGRGQFFKEHISAIEIYDPHLTLKGLRIAWEQHKPR